MIHIIIEYMSGSSLLIAGMLILAIQYLISYDKKHNESILRQFFNQERF